LQVIDYGTTYGKVTVHVGSPDTPATQQDTLVVPFEGQSAFPMCVGWDEDGDFVWGHDFHQKLCSGELSEDIGIHYAKLCNYEAHKDDSWSRKTLSQLKKVRGSPARLPN
jgi:hypothetical protein